MLKKRSLEALDHLEKFLVTMVDQDETNRPSLLDVQKYEVTLNQALSAKDGDFLAQIIQKKAELIHQSRDHPFNVQTEYLNFCIQHCSTQNIPIEVLLQEDEKKRQEDRDNNFMIYLLDKYPYLKTDPISQKNLHHDILSLDNIAIRIQLERQHLIQKQEPNDNSDRNKKKKVLKRR